MLKDWARRPGKNFLFTLRAMQSLGRPLSSGETGFAEQKGGWIPLRAGDPMKEREDDCLREPQTRTHSTARSVQRRRGQCGS